MHNLRRLALLSIFCLASACGGCFGSRELNQRAFIVAVAFDQAGEEARQEFRLTVQLPVPARMSSMEKDPGGGKTFLIVGVKAETVSEAFNRLQRRFDREIFIGHARLMLFGEELARIRGIEEFVDYFKRDFHVQRVTQLAVVRGEARKILEVLPLLEQSAADFIYNILAVEAGTSEEITTDLGEYQVLDSDEGIEPVLPVLDLEGKNIVTGGAAVMSHDRVKGWLTIPETRGLSILLAEFEPSRFVVPSPTIPGAKIAIQLREARAKHRLYLKDDKLRIVTTISGGFQTLEFTGEQGPQPWLQKGLEQTVNRAVIRDVTAAVRRAQALRADVIGYGRLVRAFYPQYWLRINWLEMFPKIKIEIRGKIRWIQAVRRPGR